MGYKPPARYDVPASLLIPSTKKVNGVASKIWPERGIPFFCSFKTYGGTEKIIDGVYSIVDTATIECWYDKRIVSGCRIVFSDGKTYEIVGEPEDIDLRHRNMKAKVVRVKGGA